MFRDLYRQVFITFTASKRFKLSFTLNCELKRANDLINDFKLTRFAFDIRQKFEPFCENRNRSRTRQTQ